MAVWRRIPPQLSHTRSSANLLSSASGKSATKVYLSQTDDPYKNLAIEHWLFQNAQEGQTLLFLYTNRPCVVIGRNQNPWLETNLSLLRKGLPSEERTKNGTQLANQPIHLVRRRSGGGTVFHDLGNVNYSVIGPKRHWDRDKYALMVTRALKSLGVQGLSVNSRHDIVQEVRPDAAGRPTLRPKLDPDRDHENTDSSSLNSASHSSSSSSPPSSSGAEVYKISGSAYKLTSNRVMHHGTCLLSSPHLALISALLRSPAESYVTRAGGVASVRSRIRNVGTVGREAFVGAVIDEFARMHHPSGGGLAIDDQQLLGDDCLSEPDVLKGYETLRSEEWIFQQTPQFTFGTSGAPEDSLLKPPLPEGVPPEFSMNMVVRHGAINSFELAGLDVTAGQGSEAGVREFLRSKEDRLHLISDWREALREGGYQQATAELVGAWLNNLFGATGEPSSSRPGSMES